MKRSGFLIFYFVYLYAISWSSAKLACGEKCSKVGETPCVDFRKWWKKFLKQLMITWYSVIGVSGFFVVWGDVGRGQQLSGQQSCGDMGDGWFCVWVWWIICGVVGDLGDVSCDGWFGLLWWLDCCGGWIVCCGLLWRVTWVVWFVVVTWIVWCGLIFNFG